MSNTSSFLLECRRRLRLLQSQVAERVGVPQQTYSDWERGEAPIPYKHRPALAVALEVDEVSLGAHAQDAIVATPTRHPRRRRHDTRRTFPVGGTLEEMARIGEWGRNLRLTVESALTPQQYRALELNFPRDTPHELFMPCCAIAFGFDLIWTSPARARCPWLVQHDFLPEYGGHLMQFALRWDRDGELLTIFGQIRLKAPYVKSSARVDFLVLYRRAGRPPQWLTVEFDGGHHLLQPNQDSQRAEGLLIPELRYDNFRVRRSEWFPLFLEDVRNAAEEGARRARRRRRAGDERRDERIRRLAARNQTSS
jgi:DNA-binding XRE family transcriptional regulator